MDGGRLPGEARGGALKPLRHPVLHRLLALGLGAVFVYASLDKIVHPAEFAQIVYHYRILGPDQHLGPLLPNLLAIVLPWVEIVVGLLLVSGIWRREAAVMAAGLLVVFVAAVAWALAHGIDVAHCGCFSVTGGGRRAGWLLIVEDLGLLAVAGLLAAGASRREAASSPEVV